MLPSALFSHRTVTRQSSSNNNDHDIEDPEIALVQRRRSDDFIEASSRTRSSSSDHSRLFFTATIKMIWCLLTPPTVLLAMSSYRWKLPYVLLLGCISSVVLFVLQSIRDSPSAGGRFASVTTVVNDGTSTTTVITRPKRSIDDVRKSLGTTFVPRASEDADDDVERGRERSLCLVCQDDLSSPTAAGDDDDEILISVSHDPNCRHRFHVACISQWLVLHDECPVCRRNYLPPEEDECDSDNVSVLSTSDAEAQGDLDDDDVSAAGTIEHDDDNGEERRG